MLILNAILNKIRHRYCVHVVRHALTKDYFGMPKSAKIMLRLLDLARYDARQYDRGRTKSMLIDLSDKWVYGEVRNLADTHTEMSTHTAETLFRKYLDKFFAKYHIDASQGSCELGGFAYNYLANLDIDLLHVSDNEKLRLRMLVDLAI